MAVSATAAAVVVVGVAAAVGGVGTVAASRFGAHLS